MPLANEIEQISGNGFWHGLPLDADPPESYCKTYYPNRVCTCGVFHLTWAMNTQGGIAFARSDTFMHGADPSDWNSPLCMTEHGASWCTCGQYQIVWEEAS